MKFRALSNAIHIFLIGLVIIHKIQKNPLGGGVLDHFCTWVVYAGDDLI